MSASEICFTEIRESPHPSKDSRTAVGSNLLSSKCSNTSQKAHIKRGNDLPLSQEFPKLQLVKERQLHGGSSATYNSCGSEQEAIPKTPQLARSKAEIPSAITQKFKIPETLFISKPAFFPETPQLEVRLQKIGKVCTVVPQTPLVNAPMEDNFQRLSDPTHFYITETPIKTKEKDTRQGYSKHLAKRQFVQVVPETPYLKFKSCDELSLYD